MTVKEFERRVNTIKRWMRPYLLTGNPDPVVISTMLEDYKKELNTYIGKDTKKGILKKHTEFLRWCDNIIKDLQTEKEE